MSKACSPTDSKQDMESNLGWRDCWPLRVLARARDFLRRRRERKLRTQRAQEWRERVWNFEFWASPHFWVEHEHRHGAHVLYPWDRLCSTPPVIPPP